METNHQHSDIEHASNYYVPLLRRDDRRRSVGVGSAVIATSVLFLILLVALIVVNQGPRGRHDHNLSKPLSRPPERMSPPERGKPEGVSEKSFSELGDVVPFNWTNTMLSWQRTAYHFQPQRNWMNDPDGPLYHMGWYHLFYQYNPDSAVWGNITWGHAVSRDLIHWLYLPFAMVPDHWFDWFGVWTGSATLLPDGRIFMIYTGDTDNYVQVQNLAYPANLSDPLLLNWTKYADNPVIFPPPGIAPKNFRDPTTAWVGPDGSWRVAIGSEINNGGMALVYRTTNFTSFELLDGPLHSVPGTGMWECVDFYPISTTGPIGLNTSANGPGTKHVLKASINNDTRDYYALGMYDPINDTWAPDNLDMDIGMGLKYDHGMYYASKTFYDESKERRILWGWIQETDAEENDIQKGWASVQTIPRVVVFDNKTGANILQWPVEEVESLRLRSTEFASMELAPGSILPLQVGPATQLDISVEFQVEFEGFEKTRLNDDESYNCTAGAATRGTFGPFGVIVLADDALSELTPVYFHVVKGDDGVPATFFCADQSRSTLATDIYKIFYGGKVPVLKGENLSMRLLVDHSIVESFAQGGRSVITARVYPTKAIYGAARIFLFNNSTGIKVTANVTVWEMNSAFIHPFPL